ncbi:hypothetical protein [Arenimonas composti]|uniref:Uncharacterized protein n=1 Tax=Arenimonas composti TR7-09 = DSM 18010 TaxID=1121013 RepID=A0A091BED4_9GAMM|nr:hypothetical protein [Arenimonas composti]KFN49179.1 hypothetical protein P873_12040 [Arenimonas composti TR7-09 = DSM 18010]
MSRTPLFTALFALVALPLAQAATPRAPTPAPALGPDGLPVVREADQFVSPPIADALRAGRIAALAELAGGNAPTAAPTAAQVGDAGAFGKDVRWLGLLSANLVLTADCTPGGQPIGGNCVSLAPAPNTTTFVLSDLASITLPGRSSETVLCHWQTPVIQYWAANNGAYPDSFNLRVTPVYTIESDVFAEVTDPSTGLPYPGYIQLGLTAVGRNRTLQPGEFESELVNGARVCIGGLLSRDSLMGSYGFTKAQARRFFRRPITIRMGLQGSARLVEDAVINIGTRFTGDATTVEAPAP